MAKIFVENFVFQPKRKTAAEWTGENPILRDGEFGIVTDGADGEWLKVGDGITAWNSLPYKKGPKGDTGAQGEKGDKGDTGAQGPQGLKGDKGDPGEQGIQGIQGIQGLKGDKGEDGYTPQKGVDYFTDEDIASLNIPSVDQTYNPTSENAQSGKAVAEAISPIRQTITVDTPVWETQPTIAGTLNESFKTWESQAYYMTLKNTDGTALESGQFKLCTTLNGYASAIDQIFTLSSGVTLSENKAVDFKTISLDRTTFEMRDAGVSSIHINTKNPKSQRYIFSGFQPIIVKGIGTKYIYLKDSAGQKVGAHGNYYSPVGMYNAYNGFLLSIIDSSVTTTAVLGYSITANRTKKGFITNLLGLRFYNNKQATVSQYCFSDVSKTIEDFTQENLDYFDLGSGTNGFWYGNGTIITLEEFA